MFTLLGQRRLRQQHGHAQGRQAQNGVGGLGGFPAAGHQRKDGAAVPGIKPIFNSLLEKIPVFFVLKNGLKDGDFDGTALNIHEVIVLLAPVSFKTCFNPVCASEHTSLNSSAFHLK